MPLLLPNIYPFVFIFFIHPSLSHSAVFPLFLLSYYNSSSISSREDLSKQYQIYIKIHAVDSFTSIKIRGWFFSSSILLIQLLSPSSTFSSFYSRLFLLRNDILSFYSSLIFVYSGFNGEILKNKLQLKILNNVKNKTCRTFTIYFILP